MEPQGQGSPGCLLKLCLAEWHGKGALIPVGVKAGRRDASWGSRKWLSASSTADCWHPVRYMGCYWDCWNGKKWVVELFELIGSSSTPFSFSILLSCWSRVFMVGPGLQDQANWGGLLRTFKRTYISSVFGLRDIGESQLGVKYPSH